MVSFFVYNENGLSKWYQNRHFSSNPPWLIFVFFSDISTSSCIYDLKYDPITGKYKTTIKIKATRDFVKDKDNVHELAFRPVSSTSQPLWTHYKPPTVQVNNIRTNIGEEKVFAIFTTTLVPRICLLSGIFWFHLVYF